MLGFNAYTAGLPTSELFRKWAAITTVAAALERKVWVHTMERPLYANMYTILIGGPGIGKTKILNEAEEFSRELADFHVAPISVTKASLIDELAGSTRRILRPSDDKPFTEFHSLEVIAPELLVFLQAYETSFMAHLNDLYDCRPMFGERRRGRDKDKAGLVIINPQLSILAGTTPSDLATLMPEGAWSQGFTSRTMLIFSGETVRTTLFGQRDMKPSLREDLIHDLRSIHNLYGQMAFSKEAAGAIENWHMAGGPPVPTLGRLEHYVPRRTAHLLKLCMAVSAARSNNLTIELIDYQDALDLLLEAEAYMPDIFRSMAIGGDGAVMDDCFNFIYSTFKKEKDRPVLKNRIINFLSQRIPSYKVLAVLDLMEKGGMITVAELGANDNHGYKPLSRH